MVRDAKKEVLGTKNSNLVDFKQMEGKSHKRSNTDDPTFQKLVKDYGKSIKAGSKGKILEKIVFDDGSCYYVVKGGNF